MSISIRILSWRSASRQRVEQGAQVEVETDLGDYEKVEGVYLPFSIESGRKNSTDKQKIIIEKAEANVSVDDAIFKFPVRPRNNPSVIVMRSLFFFSLIAVAGVAAGADEAPYNSATISGLGARNIGSATMSGRISAIAANASLRARLRSSSAPPVAAFGNRKTAAPIIVRSLTNNRCNQSALSRSIRKIPRMSGSARANRGSVTASRLATASTSRTTAARPGPTRDCRTRNASRKSSLVRKAATLFLPRCRARSGAIRPIADSTRRPTAARPGTDSQGHQSFHRLLDCCDRSDEPERDFRRRSGISGARAGPYRSGGETPNDPSGSGLFRHNRRRQNLERDHPGNEQRFPEKAIRSTRGRDRAIESEARLCLRRINRQRAFRFR